MDQTVDGRSVTAEVPMECGSVVVYPTKHGALAHRQIGYSDAALEFAAHPQPGDAG